MTQAQGQVTSSCPWARCRERVPGSAAGPQVLPVSVIWDKSLSLREFSVLISKLGVCDRRGVPGPGDPLSPSSPW